jgi:hypothetical protein
MTCLNHEAVSRAKLSLNQVKNLLNITWFSKAYNYNVCSLKVRDHVSQPYRRTDKIKIIGSKFENEWHKLVSLNHGKYMGKIIIDN